MSIVHVFSGGLDSTVLLMDLTRQKLHDVVCLNFSYGAKLCAREREAAYKICRELSVGMYTMDIDLSMFASTLLDDQGDVPGALVPGAAVSTTVPFRNAIFLSYAVGFAETLGRKVVTTATHKGTDAPPDCSDKFIRGMCEASMAGTYDTIAIQAPFQHYNKTQIVRYGIVIGAPMGLSWSCYKGLDTPCGVCHACVERIAAFKDNGIPDPALT